jgi:hypothetical protein
MQLIKDNSNLINKFFREKLNTTIQIETIVDESLAEQNKVLTPADKFEILSKEFPILLELKQLLDLKID